LSQSANDAAMIRRPVLPRPSRFVLAAYLVFWFLGSLVAAPGDPPAAAGGKLQVTYYFLPG
jgi:hypothetical protein